MEILFYILALLCTYSYFLYPLILSRFPRNIGKYQDEGTTSDCPKVSLIITAHNEQERIKDKLDNTLLLDYPKDQLEIIVASDCSTDDTDNIVNSFVDDGVLLVRADERKGKEYAQLCAIEAASGEILVFSDVATLIPETSLKNIVRQFDNKSIGAVSSEDKFISANDEIVGEGAYVKYEMWLRRLESQRAGLVGLSGSFFACRKSICKEWDIFSPSDFNTALNCAKAGMVAVSSPDVVGIYRDVKDPKLEFNRKVRTVIRGITAISRHPEVLNPFRFGLFSFQVWSHKIMRWLVPWFMLLFFIISLSLQDNAIIYTIALTAQVLFYMAAFLGWLFPASRNITLIRIIFFFVQTNLALAKAEVLFIFGKRMTVWTPSVR